MEEVLQQISVITKSGVKCTSLHLMSSSNLMETEYFFLKRMKRSMTSYCL